MQKAGFFHGMAHIVIGEKSENFALRILDLFTCSIVPKDKMSAPKKLRLITYLSPGLPVEMFEAIEDYLEEVTGLETSLLYESRWSGPPTDRKDPFTEDEVDIGNNGIFL